MDTLDTKTTTLTGVKIGTVFKKTIGRYWVRTDGRTMVCTISSKLRKKLVYPQAHPSSRRPTVDKVVDITMVDPVAVGDKVRFRDAGEDTGMITEVLPRHNKLSRRAVTHGREKWEADHKVLEQIIVTNVDQVVAVIAAKRPKPSWRLLDRYIADTELLELPAAICINKMDLTNETEIRSQVRVYSDIGYELVFTSAVDGQGIDDLRSILRDKTSVFMGKSGVGKTSLLNMLQPGLGLAVQEVSERVNKGRHTTTHLEMFPLDAGGFVIDTPGMREFSPWQTSDVSTAWLFKEMRPYIGQCKFGTRCTHSHEPGCAIKEAVEKGLISNRRYDSYLRILRGSG